MNERMVTRRRLLLASVTSAFALPWTMGFSEGPSEADGDPSGLVHPGFPRQHPERVRDTVLYSHFNLARVRELVEQSPALARATWDWGFGDWESALGAASHTGRREIAEYLISRGARPNLFTAAMLGHLEVVKATVAASPEVQGIPGPHGITLLDHARAGGPKAVPVVRFLETLEGSQPVARDRVLPADEQARYTGTYRYGPGGDELLEVLERDGALAVRRGEQAPRTLHPVSDHDFHPAGATKVRLRFHVGTEGKATALSIHDAGSELRASRLSLVGEAI